MKGIFYNPLVIVAIFIMGFLGSCVKGPEVDFTSLDETTGGPNVKVPAEFYTNINPYCCERRGLDSAAVVNDLIQIYGRVINVTFTSVSDEIADKTHTLDFDILSNTQDLDDTSLDCSRFNSQTLQLEPGEWTYSYPSSTGVQTKTFRVQLGSSPPNCFRLL